MSYSLLGGATPVDGARGRASRGSAHSSPGAERRQGRNLVVCTSLIEFKSEFKRRSVAHAPRIVVGKRFDLFRYCLRVTVPSPIAEIDHADEYEYGGRRHRRQP